DIDSNTWVVYPDTPKLTVLQRRIALGGLISLVIQVSRAYPAEAPQLVARGPPAEVLSINNRINTSESKWDPGLPVRENLRNILGSHIAIPRAPDRDSQGTQSLSQLPHQQLSQGAQPRLECGICYAYKGGEGGNEEPGKICSNAKCAQPYHTTCLIEWLRTNPETKQSLNILFGECPYCDAKMTVMVDHLHY
ncbi:hypothetical protein EV182_006510, partial [Spiromyces aspiralis]